MQKNAKFNNLRKIPGSAGLVQGVKGGRTPAYAVKGGNGSFIVADRAKLILSLTCEDGSIVEKDIYFDVKSYTDRRITDKFRDELEATLSGFDFLVENGNIINLDEALANL